MKTFFKVWNILILISNIISAIMIINAATTVGSAATELNGYARTLGGVAFFFCIIGLLPVVAVIFMAKAGLQQNYDGCMKIGRCVLILEAISVICSRNIGNAVWQIALIIVYLCVADKLRKNW